MNKQTGLLLIDIQEGFEELEYWGGHRNHLNAEQKCARLLKIWRDNSWPVFHIKHNSNNPDSPLFLGKQGKTVAK